MVSRRLAVAVAGPPGPLDLPSHARPFPCQTDPSDAVLPTFVEDDLCAVDGYPPVSEALLGLGRIAGPSRPPKVFAARPRRLVAPRMDVGPVVRRHP